MAGILVILSERVIKKDQLSKASIRRLVAGLHAWESGAYSLIVTTGGIFLPNDIQTRPIAEIMRDWLIDHGVPEDKILVESESVDTFGNIQFVDMALRSRYGAYPWGVTTLVSHWIHVKRARITARRLGWDVTTLPVYYHIGFMQFIIECVMYFVHRRDPFGRGWIPTWNRERRRNAAR